MNLGITETVLRDANQSLIATRLKLKEFENILAELDNAGYYSLECWGGATFDTCIRFLNEDPWERLRIIKQYVKNTKLQMLLRGQNLLGYRHYPDDIVKRFVSKAVENGINIIRIFDALNDIENITTAVEATKQCGAHASCAIAYTISPVHTLDGFIKLATDMVEIGADSICIKDMSGILSPANAYTLISKLKENLTVPVVLHSHCTSGMAYMTYLKAIEAGVDVLDTAISSFSGGTSQPATEVISTVAKSYGCDTGLNKPILKKINSFFTRVCNEYKESGVLDLKSLITDPEIIDSQIPGGMYSNLIKQLQGLDCIDKFEEVVSKIPSVRKDLGYPPLVTPLSQMIITQTVLNVTTGTEYGQICKEVKAYLNGEYGSAPGKISSKISFTRTRVTDEEKRNDLLNDAISKYSGNDKVDEHDLLTYILFPGVGGEFIEQKYNEKLAADTKNILSQPIESKDNETIILSEIEPDYDCFVDFGLNNTDGRQSSSIIIKAPMTGTVISINKKVGDTVVEGEILLICEAMKMENEVCSPCNGVVENISVQVGFSIRLNNKLLEINAC